MNLRTSWEKAKKDPLHVAWLAVYTLLSGVAFFFLFRWMINRIVEATPLAITPVPHIVAGGMLIADAVARFSGDVVIHNWNIQQTGLLISIILFFVLTLPLLLWGLNERARWRREAINLRFPLRIVLALGFSLPATALLFFPIAGVFISAAISDSMYHAQSVGSNRDFAVGTVGLVAMKAQSFYFVPVAEGGGGGRWMNIKGRSTSTVTLDEIIVENTPLVRIYEGGFPQKPLSYRLEMFSEDSLGIWAIGTEPGEVKLFVNKDGQEGRVQVYAGVTPQNVSIQVQN